MRLGRLRPEPVERRPNGRGAPFAWNVDPIVEQVGELDLSPGFVGRVAFRPCREAKEILDARVPKRADFGGFLGIGEPGRVGVECRLHHLAGLARERRVEIELDQQLSAVVGKEDWRAMPGHDDGPCLQDATVALDDLGIGHGIAFQ